MIAGGKQGHPAKQVTVSECDENLKSLGHKLENSLYLSLRRMGQGERQASRIHHLASRRAANGRMDHVLERACVLSRPWKPEVLVPRPCFAMNGHCNWIKCDPQGACAGTRHGFHADIPAEKTKLWLTPTCGCAKYDKKEAREGCVRTLSPKGSRLPRSPRQHAPNYTCQRYLTLLHPTSTVGPLASLNSTYPRSTPRPPRPLNAWIQTRQLELVWKGRTRPQLPRVVVNSQLF